jgi:hypothetical protein
MTDAVKKTLDQRLLWAKQNPTLCIYPYVTLDTRHSEFSSEPVYKTCCCSLDDKIFVPSPGVDPFADIKAQQLNKQWPAACWRCKSEETHGGASERVNGFVGYGEDRLKNLVETQTLPEFELRVKFSNFCNLACRSCVETESSTWAKITNTPVSEQYEVDISDSPAHWELITTTIIEKLPKVEHFHVHFIGGESLVQPGMKKLLAWMIAQGIAPQVHLRVTTALTVRPSYDLMSKLSQFKSVDINLSIDSVGDNYQYLRWPARFEKIETNLTTLMNHRPALKISGGKKFYTPRWRCLITPVFSLNNIMYVDEFMSYWHTWFNQQHYSLPIRPTNLVDRTQHLDIEALPCTYRSQVMDYLQTCLGHDIFRQYPDHTRMLYNFLDTTIKELSDRPDNRDLWLKFLSHTAYFDKKTEQSFAILNKRMYNILTVEDQNKFTAMVDQIDVKKQLFTASEHSVTFFKKLDVQSQI